MSDSLKLTAEKILEKKFPKDIKGYDAYEVDAFLDQIINDYQNIEEYVTKNDTYVSSLQGRILELEEANKALLRDNLKLKEDNGKLEMDVASLNNRVSGIKESDKPTAENLMLIKRINALERFLKASGHSESELREFLGKEEHPI